jgi:hypothetical protein
LIVIGSGIQLGRHIADRAIDELRIADDALALVDAPTLSWLLGLRPDIVNLGACYASDLDRRNSYAEMEAMILEPLSRGRRVCAVFYGHPGVYAQVPHAVIASARAAGVPAHMEPGVSSEDCLYADLGLDPGRYGVQSFEATRFMVREHAIEPSVLLLLWQVAVAGRLDCKGFEPCRDRLALLVEKLRRRYPADAPVILYEAAQLAIESFRADRIMLADLPDALIREHTTLVIPPIRQAPADEAMVARIREIEGRRWRGTRPEPD